MRTLNLQSSTREARMSGSRFVHRVGVAAAFFAVIALASSTSAGAARPRHACPKSVMRELALSGIYLSASSVRPGCYGAALMATDIDADAHKRFPRALPQKYTAYAHGTNTAGDPRAVYRCNISNKFVKTRDGGYRRTTAVCLNVKGDGFTYVFAMA
jgi:hypothetical protein